LDAAPRSKVGKRSAAYLRKRLTEAARIAVCVVIAESPLRAKRPEFLS